MPKSDWSTSESKSPGIGLIVDVTAMVWGELLALASATLMLAL